ncbi:MAG: phosphotransferase [Elusimicrobia bacterium]|nr:phosphotransferase [Elusimicrobiota bacterium]
MDESALQDLYRRAFGRPPEVSEPLKGDGSARRLFRLKGGGKTVIGALGPDPRENRAFLAFSRHFRAQGLNVPEIYAEDQERGAYLEEDLGDTNLFQYLSANRDGAAIAEPVLALYRKTARALTRFQFEAGRTLDYSVCYPRGSFDRQSMLWDLNHFKYYFLRLSGTPFDEQALEDDFQRFADYLLEAPGDFFLYRDFQSRNVMVRDGEPWFIDYQGGRKGALQYDAASLLYDAKADLPPTLRKELLEVYLDAVAERGPADRAAFMARFPGFVLVRIMQAMGTYGLRGFYERKTHFLQSIPYAVRNLESLLAAHELPVKLPALSEVWRRLASSETLRKHGSVVSGVLTVRIQSFAFKGGLPADESGHGGGFVFDCRALPNPGREKRYAELDGRDGPVADYLAAVPGVAAFLERVMGLVDASVDSYKARSFTDLSVAFGCTGGQHRSVYCAEALAEHLRARGVPVRLSHRERDKKAG